MADPTSYERQYSFRQYQAQHPSDPLPGDEVDAEFDAVKASLDETQAALGNIQRDDGELANASVGLDQLKPEVTAGVSPAVMWQSNTAYTTSSIVFSGMLLYRCIAAHTSGASFDATKFTLLADLSSIAIPPGSIGTDQLLDNSVSTSKLIDGAATPAKLGGLPGSALMGRYSTSSGAPQFITLGTGLSFSGNTLVATTAVADGSIGTTQLADLGVTSGKLAAGAAVANIGYTPVNRAGDTGISGVLQRSGQGAFLWHGGSYTSGKITLSTSDPSGGSDGDLWFKYTA